ncbi:phage protein [Robbsia andropogonis]|uniref:phage protein n=1 Tax=Robbsia andropogonis TaxID=28092 RepID=UPI003D21AFB4
MGDDQTAIDLSQLRFTFATRRGDTQTPNTLHVKIYNVSASTVTKVMKEFTRVVLQAGYEGNYGLIFDGTIKQVRRLRESPTDTVLEITAADGDSAYNFAVVSKTFAAGSTITDHVNEYASVMFGHGVTQGTIAAMPATVFPRGKVMFGLARDHLRCTARTAGMDWSIQDGRLQIVPQTAYIEGDVPQINAASGMIGLPVQTIGGIEVKMLLNPNIKIGHLIQLNNESIQRYEFQQGAAQEALNSAVDKTYAKLNTDGFYKVMMAQHQGDTRGNDWYTDVICIDADTTTNPSLASKSSVAPAGPVKPYG